MRRLLLSVGAVLLAVSPAWATSKTRATLMTDVTTNITSNASGQISGAKLRTLLNDMVDSMGVQLSSNTWDNQNVFNGAFTLPAFTNDITITKDSPTLNLNKTTDAGALLFGQKNGLSRWLIALGNGTVESGANAGSDFALARYNDAGSIIDVPFSIIRSTGVISLGGSSGALKINQLAAPGAGPKVGISSIGDAVGDVFIGTSWLGIQTGPTHNAIVGSVVQDGTNGSSFPTGVTGYAAQRSAGNTAFGLFGRADAYAAGDAVGAELNSFNFGAAPNPIWPPNKGFGTPDTVPIALTLAAGGIQQSHIALEIDQEGSTPNTFLSGIYLHASAVTNYGYYQDATATVSPTVSMFVRNTGAGATNRNLLLQMMDATPDAAAKFIQAQNSAGAEVFSVGSAGGITTLAGTASTSTATGSIIATGSGGIGIGGAGYFGAEINTATIFKVAGTQVVGARVTGWGAPSGTLDRTALAAYAGQTVSAAYVQAEAQATDNACKKASQELAAAITDLRTHGLIGN